MRQLFAFSIVFLGLSSFQAQKIKTVKAPEVVKPVKTTDIYFSNNATYSYYVDTKNVNIIKPKQVFLKILIFESNEKAFLELCSPNKQVKLVDQDIKKSHVQYDTKEIELDSEIKNGIITLTNPLDKKKITLKISRSGEYIKLTDMKTKEVYIAEEKQKNLPAKSIK